MKPLNETMISLGVSGHGLKDKDLFGKSDPYLVISRPDTRGQYTTVKQTETKKNNLNPDWADMLLSERELCNYDRDLNLR